jgi:proline dehydrogenase
MRPIARAVSHGLASSAWLRSAVNRLGIRPDNALARQFVAGETTADAIAAARQLARRGLSSTLEQLSEPAASLHSAHHAARTYLSVLTAIAAADIDRHVTLVPTRFGLLVDRATCVDNLRRILDAAASQAFFARLNMEEARHTALTLEVFETLWQQEYRCAGIVMQASLPRSLEDTRRLLQLGASIRLVKGGYPEARRVALRKPSHIRSAFVAIMRLLLSEGTSPAIATHDPMLVDETKRFASVAGITPDRFEFEMHYGVRLDLQAQLASQGYRVRVLVPFGREWLPYVLRRLGDRPANAALILRDLVPGSRRPARPRERP